MLTTSFPEYPTFSARPAVPMSLSEAIVPILAITLQLTYSGKHYVPGKALSARI
jgi:hypothetical protein